MIQTMLASARDAHRTGAWDDALAHYGAALELLEEKDDARTRADVLRHCGTVHCERGELDTASERYEASRRVAEAAGSREQVASALLCSANVEMLRGNLELSADLFLRSREAAEEVGNDALIAMVDQNLGTIANIQGNIAVALLSYRSALTRYRRLGNDYLAMRALSNMGMAHIDLAEWDASETCLNEAAELAKRVGDTMMVGCVELNRAELHLKRRRFEAAQVSVDQSLQVFHRLRAKPRTAEAYKFQGVLYRETGRAAQSDTHFALSVGMAEACQNRLLQAEAQMEWALLHLEEQRKQEAVHNLNRALGIFRELKAGREVLDVERRLTRLTEMYLPAVKGWGADLTESKDPFQSGHAQRVADYATRLAQEVGMSGWELTNLRVGALIHDIGNQAMPADLLQKADVLNAEERQLVKAHTIVGDGLARQLGFPEEVLPIVRNHHEHWAGTGYPDRLQGEEIPLGARIVGIAEVYDALTSPRSFRPSHSTDAALRIMESECRHMLDPRLFGVFRDILLRGA